jgi:hypothetical protein
MRRVKMRDSMRGAMESSSVMSVSTRISSLIESAMKESCAALANIHDKALVLEDRQVRFCRRTNHPKETSSYCLGRIVPQFQSHSRRS